MHWIHAPQRGSPQTDLSVLNDALCCDGVLHVHNCVFNFPKDDIVQTLLTRFSASQQNVSSDLSPSQRASAETALVVVLKSLMHIIYPEGGSYIVHLPVPVLKVWSVPLGLVLERQLDSSSLSESGLPRLLTLSSPLEDFGTVTWNGFSLDKHEEILFVSSDKDALCLTRNHKESKLTVWHVSPAHLARRKVSSFCMC
jgi:Anaphase-promoting complex subunit 1